MDGYDATAENFKKNTTHKISPYINFQVQLSTFKFSSSFFFVFGSVISFQASISFFQN